GLPFVILSANAPLVQRWFARTDHPAARDPYFLYAASNVGSLAGLFVYPVAIEPALTLSRQSAVWTAGYALLVALTWGTAAAAARRPTASGPDRGQAKGTGKGDRQGGQAAGGGPLAWLALAFVPSALMLSVTTFISTDIAAVPL